MAKITVRNDHSATIYAARASQPDPKDPRERRAVRDAIPIEPKGTGDVDSDNPSVAIYMKAGMLVPLASA